MDLGRARDERRPGRVRPGRSLAPRHFIRRFRARHPVEDDRQRPDLEVDLRKPVRPRHRRRRPRPVATGDDLAGNRRRSQETAQFHHAGNGRLPFRRRRGDMAQSRTSGFGPYRQDRRPSDESRHRLRRRPRPLLDGRSKPRPLSNPRRRAHLGARPLR